MDIVFLDNKNSENVQPNINLPIGFIPATGDIFVEAVASNRVKEEGNYRHLTVTDRVFHAGNLYLWCEVERFQTPAQNAELLGKK